MLPDRVSNPGPLTYESGALPIALRGPASLQVYSCLGVSVNLHFLPFLRRETTFMTFSLLSCAKTKDILKMGVNFFLLVLESISITLQCSLVKSHKFFLSLCSFYFISTVTPQVFVY